MRPGVDLPGEAWVDVGMGGSALMRPNHNQLGALYDKAWIDDEREVSKGNRHEPAITFTLTTPKFLVNFQCGFNPKKKNLKTKI